MLSQRELDSVVSAVTRRMSGLIVPRPAFSAARRQIRLARTGPNPDDSTYPSDGNTFYGTLLDGTFTEDDGDQTPTYTDRSDAPSIVFHNVDGRHIAEGTIVAVFRDGGRWWTITPGVSADLLWRNDGEDGDAPPFALLQVLDADSDGSGGAPFLSCSMPTDTLSRVYAINTTDDEVAEGEFGTCKLWGAPAWVLKDSGTPTFGEGWGPKPFQWSAAPNYPGLVATGETFGSGDDARMVVIGHQIDRLIGKPTSDIATDDDGVVTVWVGASGSEAASSYLITVRNWSGVTLGAGKRCWIVWVNGAWYAEPWEC